MVIRSYYRDLGWLRHCLASIDRWCTGFRRTIVVLPRSSLGRWRQPRLEPVNFEIVQDTDYPDDYLGQQVTKMYADELTDATHIVHVDSDCVFRRPFAAPMLFRRDRPLQLMEPYAVLSRHVPWRGITERFLGRDTPYEFMRQPPYVFPRWLYADLRAFCLARHHVTLADYVLAQPPRGFSEFNALAGFAWHYHREAFTWVDLRTEPLPEPACRVFWSRAGLDDAAQAEISRLLA